MGAGELFDAAAQATEAQDLRGLIQFAFDLVAQVGKEEKFAAFAGGVGQSAEVDSKSEAHGSPFNSDRRLFCGDALDRLRIAA